MQARSGLPRRPAGSDGQALTEFLIVSTFLLIPLLLLIPVIAGLISQKQDVEIAARYAAWERTVWNRETHTGSGGADTAKTDAQIAREIDARIFSQDTTPIASGTGTSQTFDAFSYRPHDGSSLIQARLDPGGAGALYTSHDSTESGPGGLAGVGDDAMSALGRFTRFDLNADGQIDATVSIDVADLSAWFGLADVDLDRLRLVRRNRLFVEAWTGGPKRDVERVVSGLLPQQFFDGAAVRNVQDFAAFAPGAREIRSDWLVFGHVDIDPLPAYRLSPEPAPP